MAIIEDPEGNETIALHRMIDFADREVLEVGCGDGRLTWRYAERAAHVTAIDPDQEDIETALANLPEQLRDRVTFVESAIDEFAQSIAEPRFDVSIFAWSL